MPTPHTFEVETVFSAEEASVSGGRLRVLGFLTLLVGAGWLYATWGPMYRWINRTVAIGGLSVAMGALDSGADVEQTAEDDLNTVMGVLTGRPAEAAGAEPSAPESAPPDKPTTATLDPETLGKAQLAMSFLPVAGYAWLGLATFTGLWLMMGALAAVAPGGRARTVGKLVLAVVVVAMAGLFAYARHEWDWVESVMPSWVKPALGGLLVLLACSLGASLNRRRVWLHRAGGVLIILSALGSVAAIWGAVRWGQMPDENVDLLLYAKVFGLQSAYGWVTLVGMIGLKQRRA